MSKKISEKLLNVLGWTITSEVELPKKAVICVAPHTSNWDFLWGLLFRNAAGFKSHFFIKQEWFRFPLGGIMKALGGIPVNRTKKTSMTDVIAAEFSKKESFHVAITPEGTRKYRKKWKKGFYFIAETAQVPVVVTVIDYKRKELGFKAIVNTTGDVNQDFHQIQSYYDASMAKKPSNFGKD